MPNLFWRSKDKNALNLLSRPFATEEELERTVFHTSKLLEDIVPLKRQVRGGKKAGIPDIIGVDADGNICIIEIKNVPVTADILPQVLHYAFWAESNPDSIKSIWLELDETPENISLSFDSYGVRIVIIAPSIDPSTLGLSSKINYPVDLIEVTRWVEGHDQFLLVHKLEHDHAPKARPVRGLAVYDKQFYDSQYNKESVVHFLRFVEETSELCKAQGWPLEPKFNKFYCGFKYGSYNAFGIKWLGSKSFGYFIKLPEAVARKLSPKGIQMARYENEWKEAVYRIDPENTDVKAYAPLLSAAFDKLTGKSA